MLSDIQGGKKKDPWNYQEHTGALIFMYKFKDHGGRHIAFRLLSQPQVLYIG